MNDLIKQFEKQCWNNQTNHLDSEKFAKAIIEECIKIIHMQERIPKEYFYPKPAFIHDLSIRKHFGLAE